MSDAPGWNGSPGTRLMDVDDWRDECPDDATLADWDEDDEGDARLDAEREGGW